MKRAVYITYTGVFGKFSEPFAVTEIMYYLCAVLVRDMRHVNQRSSLSGQQSSFTVEPLRLRPCRDTQKVFTLHDGSNYPSALIRVNWKTKQLQDAQLLVDPDDGPVLPTSKRSGAGPSR